MRWLPYKPDVPAFLVAVPDMVGRWIPGTFIPLGTDGYGLDMLVNNAGFGYMAPVELITGEDMRLQFGTNVFGLVEVTQAFLPEMRARRAGKVVNL